MRFLINFFIFGFIFFLIYLFFPEAFATLVSWAQRVYDFFHDIVMRIQERWNTTTPKSPPSETQPTAQLAMIFLWFV